MKFDLPKIIASCVWLLIIINLFLPFSKTMELILDSLAVILLLGHLGEYCIFRKKIAEKGDSTVRSFFMTMLFGFLYWKY